MANRTQQEIMKNWKTQDPPLVSVCCITYNHEPYIRDAIEGFLMQKTDFPFEIIIHDDASTDRTTDIIREYHAQYPDIIRPVYQTENQYSQGIMISPTFVWPKARGEYIALCEGDDYWTDSQKLQIQIGTMKKHPKCEMSFHTTTVVNLGSNTHILEMAKFGTKEKVFPTSSFICGKCTYIATSSLMFRTSVLESPLIPLLKDSPTGDYPLRVISSLAGGGVYIPETMSCYRKNNPGSWSERSSKKTVLSIYKSYLLPYLLILGSIDALTEFRWTNSIKKAQSQRALSLAMRALRDTDFQCFIKFTRISWSIKRFVSARQVVFSLFRNHGRIILTACNLLRTLIRAKR